MGAQLGSESAMNEINMTPLIDIVLVVLIIMMVNMPIEVQELGIKLPNPNTPPAPAPPEGTPEQLMVALYENGDVALNRRVMTERKLREQLAKRLRQLSKKNVFVDAHPDVPLKAVVDILDLAGESGAEKVGFAKMKEDGPLPPTGVETGAMARGVIPGNPTITERLEEKKLDTVIVDAPLQAILPAIRGCYFTALGTNPRLTGDYLIEITVGPDGRQMAEHPPEILKDSMKDSTVSECVLQQMPQMAYPPIGQDNTAVIRYSLLFSPG